jgi:hypothetical protein
MAADCVQHIKVLGGDERRNFPAFIAIAKAIESRG